METVTVICHHSPTRDTCPALYRTDAGEYYVQGHVVTDSAVLAQMDVPEDETVVSGDPGACVDDRRGSGRRQCG